MRKYFLALSLCVLLAGLVVVLFNSRAVAQEAPSQPAQAPAGDVASSFTYQGYLVQGEIPYNGNCDFEFRLFGAATGGTQIGSTQSRGQQAVSGGRFTVELNFGAGAINGQARWLQIAVRCPSGVGAYTTLTPRQVLTATPFALSLLPGAGVSGTVASGGILNLANSSTSQEAVGLNVALAPTGVQIVRASNIGVAINSAGTNGLQVNSAGNNGLQVESAAENGLQVDSAGNNGIQVGSASANGFQVDSAGAPSISYYSPFNNGLEVAGAEGFGLYVGRADQDGIRIRSAADDSIQIGEDGIASFYGLYVPAPGTTYTSLLPNTADSRGEWGLYTTDSIFAANIGIGAQTLVAVAAADVSAGDVVAAAGLADPLADSLTQLVQVRPADGTAGIVGVVEGRLQAQPAPGKEGVTILHSVAGPAKAGDTVAIKVLGVAQARVQTGEAVQPGQRVTVGQQGTVRALQTRVVDGMVVSEGAPTIGVALTQPDGGRVWVFVSPQ